MAQKIKASTQKFIEVTEIRENVALLVGGNACMVIEVQAVNFDLLSLEEQQARITSYASLLNSLSFPIQIIIRNKLVDVSAYLKLLEIEAEKTTNEKVEMYIRMYKDFVQEMIKVNSVLEKKFYMVVPFSSLEKGAVGVLRQGDFFTQAKTALQTKVDSLMSQLARLSLRAKVLENTELIQLFYDVFNEDSTNISQTETTGIQPILHIQREGK